MAALLAHDGDPRSRPHETRPLQALSHIPRRPGRVQASLSSGHTPFHPVPRLNQVLADEERKNSQTGYSWSGTEAQAHET